MRLFVLAACSVFLIVSTEVYRPTGEELHRPAVSERGSLRPTHRRISLPAR